MKLTPWSISDVGLTRASNQDSIGYFPQLNLFIVADGMGGHAHGDVASRMAVEAVHELVQESAAAPADSDAELLRLAVELANQRIHETGLRDATQPRARALGTTIVALRFALDAARASWGHVGDSRLYRLRHSRLALLTADHTIFGQKYWDKRSTIPTSLRHTNQLVQALGVTDRVDVTIASDSIQIGDLFLLCSDGVSGQVDPEAIETQLRTSVDPRQACEALIRLAREAGGADNASAILVQVVDD